MVAVRSCGTGRWIGDRTFNRQNFPANPQNPRLHEFAPTSPAYWCKFWRKTPSATLRRWLKQRGINEFADANYPEALKLLKQSWKKERKDPETLIYINNALLKAINAEYYTIAIVVPIRRNQDGSILNANLAEELLRGIAQAQTEVNLGLLKPNDKQ